MRLAVVASAIVLMVGVAAPAFAGGILVEEAPGRALRSAPNGLALPI